MRKNWTESVKIDLI